MNAAALLAAALALAAGASDDALRGGYAIDRYVIAGGTSSSSGGTYRVDGTAGQAEADALQPAASGRYELVGGFWAGLTGGGGGDTIFRDGFE